MTCSPLCNRLTETPAAGKDRQNVLEIRMQEGLADCWACGGDAADPKLGIPIYEGMVLPNDWKGEWGGVPACPACFIAQGRLTEPMGKSDFRQMVSDGPMERQERSEGQ